jgi:hypothetical protein
MWSTALVRMFAGRYRKHVVRKRRAELSQSIVLKSNDSRCEADHLYTRTTVNFPDRPFKITEPATQRFQQVRHDVRKQ